MYEHNLPDCFDFDFADVDLLADCFQSLLEFVNSTASVNEFLLTGKEGMTLRADFNFHFAALGGLGCYRLAASALNDHFFVVGMNSGLHLFTPHFTSIRNGLYYITFFRTLQEILRKKTKYFQILQLSVDFAAQSGDYFLLQTGNIGL